jgi:hypothetical protein
VPTYTYDLRNATARPAAWSKQGSFVESFSASGMSASLLGGQGWTLDFDSMPAGGYTVVVKVLTNAPGAFGPAGVTAAGNGAQTSLGGGGNDLIYGLELGGYIYTTNFGPANGTTAGTPQYLRFRTDGADAYHSSSTNGTSWNTEGKYTGKGGGFRIFLGSSDRSAGTTTITIESVTVTAAVAPTIPPNDQKAVWAMETNVGLDVVEAKNAREAMEVNVGVYIPVSTLIVPQVGWGIPIEGDQDLLVYPDSNPREAMEVNVKNAPSLVLAGATIGKDNFPTSWPSAKAGDLVLIGVDRGQVTDTQMSQVAGPVATGQSEYDFNLRVYAGRLAADGGGITGFSATMTGDVSWAVYRDAILVETVVFDSGGVNTYPSGPLSLTPPVAGKVAVVHNAYTGPGQETGPGWTQLSTWNYTYGRSSQYLADADPAQPYVIGANGGGSWQVVMFSLT